ncbi:hypothetical protein ACFYZ9_33890 [Streptomyces sp. NPDC001691]|uniref:hypothetical protein n=1 Tax=Streptomyces sp. NPDC001691 TaxID=3364600 RepID=UPI00368F0BDB
MSSEKTALGRATELYEELGRGHRSAEFAADLISHRDRELAAKLLAAGMSEAAALLTPPADDAPPPTVTIYIGMASAAGSTEEYTLEPDEIPPGWHLMTEDEKSAFMQPLVQGHMDNVIQAGWDEA